MAVGIDNPQLIYEKFINNVYEDLSVVRSHLDIIVSASKYTIRYQVSPIPPGTRFDGSALQVGDIWFNQNNSVIFTWTHNQQWETEAALLNNQIDINQSAIGALDNQINGIGGILTITDGIQTDLTAAEGAISIQGAAITALEIETAGIASNTSAINALSTQVDIADGNITTLASDVTALQTSVNDPTSGIIAIGAATDSLSTQINVLDGQITIASNAVNDVSVSVLMQDFDANQVYSEGEYFKYLGSTYKVMTGGQTPPNATPPNPTYYASLANTSLIDLVNAGSVDLSATASQVNVVSAAVGFTAFSTATTYEVGEYFSYLGTVYEVIATQTPPNAVPPNAGFYTVPTSQSLAGLVGYGSVKTESAVVIGNAAQDTANGLLVKYGVTLNNNNYITGFSQFNDGTSGTFSILADSFLVVDPANLGQNPVTPFEVSNGVTYIKSAMIEAGSITTAQISNATITNAQIVEDISSANWTGIAPFPGWNIAQSGTASFSQILIRDSAGNIILGSGGELADTISNNAIALDQFNQTPLTSRQQHINHHIDNPQASTGWYEIAQYSLEGTYSSFNFNGLYAVGASGGRVEHSGRLAFNVQVTLTQLNLGTERIHISSQEQAEMTDLFRIYRTTDGVKYTWHVYIKLVAFRFMRLAGEWMIGGSAPFNTGWIDDSLTTADSLGAAYAPAGTQLTNTYNYSPGATVGADWNATISNYPGDVAVLNANTTPADIGYTGDLNADVTGDAVTAFSTPLPNWDFSLLDSNGNPAGIYPVENIADFSGVSSLIDGNDTFIRLSHASDTSIAYGFPAIEIDDQSEYEIKIRHRASSVGTTGLYLRFQELNDTLDSNFTHVGVTGGVNAKTRTGIAQLSPIVSTSPFPSSTFTTETFTYTPTAGTKVASFSMYNFEATTVDYDVERVLFTRKPGATQLNSNTVWGDVSGTANAPADNADVTNVGGTNYVRRTGGAPNSLGGPFISVLTGNGASDWGLNFAPTTSASFDVGTFDLPALDTNTDYVLSFLASCTTGGAQLNIDLIPDTLPEFLLTVSSTIATKYAFVFNSAHADMATASLRFFRNNSYTGAGQTISIYDIKFEKGTQATDWSPYPPSEDAANNTTLTSQLTDDANLGETAFWTNVQASDPNAPANNADVTADQLSGSGVNMANYRYSVFESIQPAVITTNGTNTYDTVQAYFGGTSLKISATAPDCFTHLGIDTNDYNIPITPNKKWIVSTYVRTSIASTAMQLFIVTKDLALHYNIGTTLALANTWYRVFGVIDLTADDSTLCRLRVDNDGGAGVDMWFDGIMMEEQIGTGSAPSAYTLPAGVPEFVTDFPAFTQTSWNTMMPNAYVGTAHIEDLSVNTFKIEDQAVTIPASVYTAAAHIITGNTIGAYTTINSLVVSSSGNPATINFGVLFTVGLQEYDTEAQLSGPRGTSVRLYDLTTTTVLRTYTFNGINDTEGERIKPIYVPVGVTLSSGNHTLQLQVSQDGGNTNGTAANRTITYLEVKK